MEIGHFDKYLLKTQEEKPPHDKILEFLLLDTLKITFWMENLTLRWTLIGPFFFQNQDTFSDFQKKEGEASPISP